MPNLSIGTVLLIAAMSAVLLLLSGCVTRRGPQEISCPAFFDHVHDGKGSSLIREIQRDALNQSPTGLVADAMDSKHDPLAEAIENALGVSDNENLVPLRPNILLLSGGGQWGAYGAGLFEQLSKNDDRQALPDIGIITGISTGSLQTLLLMVALDPDKDAETRALAIQRLVEGYDPEFESEVVRNTGMLGVPLFGSQAGTAPLRRRIAEALRPAEKILLIDEIRSSTIRGFIGFVEADSGHFRYVDVNQMLKAVGDDKKALDCLTAATMASSAMPVFHQQLRVIDKDGNPHSLYDGGARRSVFFDSAMEQLDRAVRKRIVADRKKLEDRGPAEEREKIAAIGFADSYRAAAPIVYVVRNGPTVRKRDPGLNTSDGIIANGQRGYDLLVNESEIGAIAALRLYNSYGTIMVTTADEYGKEGAPGLCRTIKRDKMMFDPDFMDCLRELGKFKALRGPWWPLSPLDRPPPE